MAKIKLSLKSLKSLIQVKIEIKFELQFLKQLRNKSSIEKSYPIPFIYINWWDEVLIHMGGWGYINLDDSKDLHAFVAHLMNEWDNLFGHGICLYVCYVHWATQFHSNLLAHSPILSLIFFIFFILTITLILTFDLWTLRHYR